jgi:AhpC/TSA family
MRPIIGSARLSPRRRRQRWLGRRGTQLCSLRQALPELEPLGASLVAVSPQQPDRSPELVDKHALTFEVLTDSKSRDGTIHHATVRADERPHLAAVLMAQVIGTCG